MPSIAVVIPALNEASTTGRLVPEVRRQAVDWVIVADNGSTDDTAVVAERVGATVCSEPRRGYGYACAAGAEEAIRLGAEVLVFMDGDGSADPADIPALLAPLLADRADLVLGARHTAARAMPAHQLFGNWLCGRLINRLYGLQISDLGPFRAIRSDRLAALQMAEMTFGWPTEMIVKVARGGGRIVEVPVVWHKRRAGRSKISGTIGGSFRAAYHILAVTLRYAFLRKA